MYCNSVFKLATVVVLTTAAIGAVAAPPEHEQHASHWAYTGESGPEHWANLDAKNAICGAGLNQSPIDLDNFIEAELGALKLDYRPTAVDILNNGHAIQVGYAAGSSLTIEGRSFELKQFHFHSPSENTLRGKQFPLEAHLVHQDSNGNLAVVAVMFDEGAQNAFLDALWKAVPQEAGKKGALPAGLNASSLLPVDRDYYRFNGSLTTPPCSEGVLWAVLKQQSTVSKAQLAQFSAMLGFANNRPVQPRNARPVLQ